jgi:FO synthase
MAGRPEPTLDELRRTVAVARLLLGPDVNVQAPPNLSPGTYPALIASGLNDWGGVSPLTIDYINPEAPWPHLAALEAATAAAGARLRERLAIYPEFIHRPGFVPEVLRRRVLTSVDDAGLVPDRATRVAT